MPIVIETLYVLIWHNIDLRNIESVILLIEIYHQIFRNVKPSILNCLLFALVAANNEF